MKEEFVKYKEALALKKLGFDEPCFAWTIPNEENFIISSCERYGERFEKMVQIPLYSQAFRWFRDKYNLHQSIIKYSENRTFWVQIEMIDEKNKVLYATNLSTFTKYPDAELACLKKLINIVKEIY